MDKLQSNMLKGIIVSAICLAPLPISAATPPTAKAAATVAQDDGKTVGGTVLDENGEPVIGATVTVKGTNLVTVTDIDGRFELKVPNGSILSVSYLGYTTAEVPATGENLTISLKPDERQLAEVVVTALGIRRSEKALSYNVQQVNSEQLTTVKSANFMNSLAGKVAGVNINASSAGVGGATRVVRSPSTRATRPSTSSMVCPSTTATTARREVSTPPSRVVRALPTSTPRTSSPSACSAVLPLPPSMVPLPPRVSS